MMTVQINNESKFVQVLNHLLLEMLIHVVFVLRGDRMQTQADNERDDFLVVVVHLAHVLHVVRNHHADLLPGRVQNKLKPNVAILRQQSTLP